MSGFQALLIATAISIITGIMMYFLDWMFRKKGMYIIAGKIAIIIRTYGILTRKGKGGLKWQ